MVESCVDVDPRNTSNVRIVFPKNPTSRDERELEDCGHAVHKNWREACVKDRCTRKHIEFELLEKEGRKRTEPLWVSFDCTTQDADTTLEYENEPGPEVFQEAKIYSCAEVVVRITDDSPSLNWIPHFAMQFLNKTRIGCRGKKFVAQFGEEELRSYVKRIFQEVFVCHHDRTRTISYITKSGSVRSTSWTRQILSDAWESMIVETKLAIEGQPRMVIKESLEVECRKFNVSKLTDTWEVVRDTRCLFCMDKRQNHVRMNSESESDELLREPWQEKPRWREPWQEKPG